MKRLITGILFLSLAFCAYAEGISAGLRVGTVNPSDCDSATSFGGMLQYEINDNSRLRITVDTYSTEYEPEVVNTGMSILRYDGAMFHSYGYYLQGAVDIDANSIFFDYNWVFNLKNENIKPYIGAGIGYTMLDTSMDYDVKVGYDDSLNTAMFNMIRSQYTVEADIDDFFSYGVVGGVEYKITDRFSVGLELNYIMGETDLTETYSSNDAYASMRSYETETTLDMNSFGAVLAANYKFN